MKYNRTMVANSKEQKALNAAQRDATSKFVLLMNHLHALDLRYFANKKLREEEKDDTVQQIMKLKKHLPETIRSKVFCWINDGSLWREDLDSIHCML